MMSTPAGAEPLSANGTRALDDLAACLQSRPLVAVAIVIDESGSLRTTDPSDQRAEILSRFITRLADLSEGEVAGRNREVHLNIGFFGSDYSEWLAWQQLDPAGAEALADRAAQETARRKAGVHTRHRFAVDPTREAIDRISAELGPRDLCTMVVWFSDGELDPDNQPQGAPDRPAVVEATDELCAPGGLLDRFRRTDATLIGIMLDSSSIDRSGRPLPRKREMVEGDGPNGRCGTAPARGVYLEGELEVLGRLFEQVAAVSQGGTSIGPFTGDPIDFPVDGGVGRIRIVGPASGGFDLRTASGRELLTSPDGATSGALAGSSLVVRTADVTSIDVTVEGDFGTWRLNRRGEGGPIDVYYFADLTIEPDAATSRLARGAPSILVGRITTLDGGAVDASLFSRKELTIEIGEDVVPVDIAADGSFRLEVADVTTEEAVLPVTFRLEVVTERGVDLQPIVRALELNVTLPEQFPTVELDAGERFEPAVRSRGDTATVDVTVTGSRLGPTRVCLAANDASGLTAIRLTTANPCLDLAASERRVVRLEAELQKPSLESRGLEPEVIATLTSAPTDGSGPVDLQKVLRPTLSVLPPPPNETIRWLLLALGLLIPLAGLMFANRAAARFSTRSLQSARVPVVLDPRGVGVSMERVDESRDDLLHDSDFTYLASSLDGARRHQFESEQILARVPRNPYGSVSAEVVATAGHRVVSNVTPTTTAEGMRAGLRLTPQRCAYLVVPDAGLRKRAVDDSDDDATIPATLVVFLTPVLSGDPDQLEQVIHDVRDGLVDPKRLEVLRAAAIEPDGALPRAAPPDAEPSVSDPPRTSTPSDSDPWGAGSTRASGGGDSTSAPPRTTGSGSAAGADQRPGPEPPKPSNDDPWA